MPCRMVQAIKTVHQSAWARKSIKDSRLGKSTKSTYLSPAQHFQWCAQRKTATVVNISYGILWWKSIRSLAMSPTVCRHHLAPHLRQNSNCQAVNSTMIIIIWSWRVSYFQRLNLQSSSPKKHPTALNISRDVAHNGTYCKPGSQKNPYWRFSNDLRIPSLSDPKT